MVDRYLRDVLDGENRVSQGSRSVNIGNIGATEDAARRRFAAVATHAASHDQPLAAARLARDIDQRSRSSSDACSRKMAAKSPAPGACSASTNAFSRGGITST